MYVDTHNYTPCTGLLYNIHTHAVPRVFVSAGIYQQMNIEQPELTLEDYEELATSEKYSRPEGPIDFIEQR